MKKIINLLLVNAFVFIASAQQQLHIHHINIENGDATVIGIYDESQHKYTAKILIDGGQSPANTMLLPYLKKMMGSSPDALHFDYVMLTHYHDDHYKGLLALQTGLITADSIVDPGGYKVSTIFKHSANSGTKPTSLVIAQPWLTALKAAAHHSPKPYVKGRSQVLIRFDKTASTSIGNTITIGKVGNNDVQLECISGWGNTLSSGGQIVSNPAPTKNNANNFTLAFILHCGEFRYFIGGDMGGSGGQYIDQETTATQFFNETYPSAKSMSGDATAKGHICGFKANHHGSKNSNTPEFIQDMKPAIVVTSGGNKPSWHLPNPDYLKRLQDVKPLSASVDLPDGSFNQGFYFTNLYNFSSSFPSLTTANTAFKNKPGISYNYGNDAANKKAGYLIKVTDADGISEKSSFEVGRVDITNAIPYQKLATFSCHKK